MFRITIPGKVKPYVRMTQRGKFYDPQAKQYLASKEAIKLEMISQINRAGIVIPKSKAPLFVSIIFLVPNRLHGCDLDNLIKSVLDAGNKILWSDDRYIDRITASRAIDVNYLTIIEFGEIL